MLAEFKVNTPEGIKIIESNESYDKILEYIQLTYPIYELIGINISKWEWFKNERPR